MFLFREMIVELRLDPSIGYLRLGYHASGVRRRFRSRNLFCFVGSCLPSRHSNIEIKPDVFRPRL